MNYVLKPSLEHIVLVKIATTLWNQSDIKAVITVKNPVTESGIPILGNHHSEEWSSTEEKVLQNVSQIPVPERLQEKIRQFIHPIGSQILQWIGYHNESPYFGTNIPDEFCWTPQGTIDKKKTAEVCAKDESVDIIKRYCLACNYCLMNDIVKLWDRIPETRKKYFYSQEEDPQSISQAELVVCCTYYMKGEMDRLNNRIEKKTTRKCSPYFYVVEYAAESRNKAALEYFFQKLSPREKEKYMIKLAVLVANYRFYSRRHIHTNFRQENSADILCFLLSRMDETQQTEVFKLDTFKALGCFLDWPWQSVFMETASRTWRFLSKEHYYGLLLTIIEKEIHEYQDYNYRSLFREFWEQSPEANRQHCVCMCTIDMFLLSKLFEIEDEDNIRLILQNATVNDKEQMIFKRKGIDICRNLFSKDKYELLKVLVQECISSKNVLRKFQAKFEAHMMRRYNEENLKEEKDTFKKFFDLLDDFVQ